MEKTTNWLGRYDLERGTHEEVLLPVEGYVHVGYDPKGRFLVFENHGETHDCSRFTSPFSRTAPNSTSFAGWRHSLAWGSATTPTRSCRPTANGSFSPR